MNIRLNQSVVTLTETEPVITRPSQTEYEPEEDDIDEIQVVVKEGKDLASRSKDNINAAFVNFIVNIETTIAIILVLNQGITDEKDKVSYGLGIVSIFFAYLMSFLLSGDQPFFKGLTLTQAYVIQTQVALYGLQSLFMTVFVAGIIIITLTLVKAYRIVRSTPACILIALQISVGTFYLRRPEAHHQGAAYQSRHHKQDENRVSQPVGEPVDHRQPQAADILHDLPDRGSVCGGALHLR